jgi:predicted DCC family thiol-disulfide oxidoreductase YuxK
MKRDWSPVPAGEVKDGLILFDGVCVLCSRWVAFVIKRDPAARFRFLPIQTPRGREIARRFQIDEAAPETTSW